MKRIIVLLAILIASAVAVPTVSAQGKFLDFAKATAGIMVAGVVVCTATNALNVSGLAVCTPQQRAVARPIQPSQAHMLQPRVVERLVIVERQRLAGGVANPATSQLPTLDEAVAKATAALGGKPTDGRKYGGVSGLAENTGFKCPNGQVATRVKHVSVQGYDLDRWFCP